MISHIMKPEKNDSTKSNLAEGNRPSFERLNRAYDQAKQTLLAERNAQGFWQGELSSSGLSTAVSCIAFQLNCIHQDKMNRGLNWLIENQNQDGGWGDTVKSNSNISTSMLVLAAFEICKTDTINVQKNDGIAKLEGYLAKNCGKTASERAESIRKRYGKDRTFSVPILMTCALAGIVDWEEVPRLPFEIACFPQSWFRFFKMHVVSYALPALIAIGHCIHRHRRNWNPVRGFVRKVAVRKSMNVLRKIQPTSGGYLEASPLTAFVCMSLATSPTKTSGDEAQILTHGLKFLESSQRENGSWAIDTDLAIWLTTLSVNALSTSEDLQSLPDSDRQKLLVWIQSQQTKTVHPFTGAAPGAWGWTDQPGSVPDCDDTPGAVIALKNLGEKADSICLQNAYRWMIDLQNRDGGFPTFCRGWGALPFDRSGCDLTAHAIRALPAKDHTHAINKAFAYLKSQQRSDGSWLPLWFGNQYAPDDINPVYGTARVLAAYRDCQRVNQPECQNAIQFLLRSQKKDGSWGGFSDTDTASPGSIEETAVVVEVLLDLCVDEVQKQQIWNAVVWLILSVENNKFKDPTPIGFYFAKLWYFEKLYPIIFTVAALGKARLLFKPRDPEIA